MLQSCPVNPEEHVHINVSRVKDWHIPLLQGDDIQGSPKTKTQNDILNKRNETFLIKQYYSKYKE